MKIKFVLAFTLLSTLPLHAEELGLRDKNYKKEHLSTLGPKKGYQGTKDWDNFLPMVIKHEDKDIFRKMLSVETSPAPTEFAQYTYDLFLIYKAKPVFFVTEANKFYHNDMNCVVRIFKTNPMIITDKELKASFEVKSSLKEFDKFEKLTKQLDYSKEALTDTAKHVSTCNLIKAGKH